MHLDCDHVRSSLTFIYTYIDFLTLEVVKPVMLESELSIETCLQNLIHFYPAYVRMLESIDQNKEAI